MTGYGNSTGGAERDTAPAVEVFPRELAQGTRIELRGMGWTGWRTVELRIDGQSVAIDRVLQGLPAPDRPQVPAERQGDRTGNGVQPDGAGAFLCRVSTLRLEPGEHCIMATSSNEGHKVGAETTVVVRERSGTGGASALPRDLEGGEASADDVTSEGDLAFQREQFHWERRFGHLGRIPSGVRETQIAQVRALRERRDRLEASLRAGAEYGDVQLEPDPSVPVPGVANWTPVGAAPVVFDGTGYSGRALSIAIDPTNTDALYLGTANGGVWKSTDRGLSWTPKSDYQRSLAIGALAIDPNDHLHIIAGTGEMNSSIDSYYGNGLLSSLNGGDTWTELGTTVFDRDEINRLLFDPTDTTGKRLLLSSSIGVCESTDGGVNWTVLTPGPFNDMVALRVPGPAGTVKVIAAQFGNALWTSTRTSGTWSTWTATSDPALPAAGAFDRVAMTQQAGNPAVVLALFATFPGFAALARTTDGGNTWSQVPIRLNFPCTSETSVSAGHTHFFTVPAADLAAPATAHTYTSTTSGTPLHTHTITFTAQQFARLAGGGPPVSLTTNTDATGHTHTVDFSVTAQSYYNLYVAVHPTDSNIVFLGETNLWRSTTAGGVFDFVPTVHSDHHAFVFDPVNPAICWAASDGGIQTSTDTGQTWSHRNRDLATLQYESIAQHPDWENVMIGGTQDNGVQRYAGSPAWTVSAFGDGGSTAIDPSKPTRMYQEYVREAISRSDDAGASWNLKNSGITGRVLFYAPFALDPTTPTTCYFGGDQLWRSENSADTWSSVSAGPGQAITAIAVHPADSNTVYVGTEGGRVYRYRRTGATWNPADVTITDMTGPSLPLVSISDIAVDSAGTVWVTIAGLLNAEEPGEFSNDHVYRHAATDPDTVWTTRSNGLAQANPINAIVIDPANNNRLFCGGDLSVFRTEDAGQNWFPWDQGLPNAPVFDLALHGKRRLLRAGTHGRSVWERPVDAGPTRMVDLYIRDIMLDSGRLQPSPSGVVDPFDASATPGTMWWWQSPDILVDAPQPDYQTPNPVGDYVALTQIVHRTARRGRVNRFYVQVHNRGISEATNVRVRPFLADASAGLPALPADFWSSGKPFVGDPIATAWTPLGPTQTIARLDAAEPGVLEWDFLIPSTAAEHSCVLAVATCDEDPQTGSGIFDVGTLVTSQKYATLKNLQVEDAVPGGVTPSRAFILQLNNTTLTDQPFGVVFEWASLPEGTRLYIAFEKLGNDPEPQHGHEVQPLDNADQFLPKQFTDRNGVVRKFDFARSYVMTPDEHRKNELRGVHIDPERGSRAMAVNVRLPEGTDTRAVEFNVLQKFRNRLLGGTTYVVRPVQTLEHTPE